MRSRTSLACRVFALLLGLALAAGTCARSAPAEQAFRLIAYASGHTDFARIPAAKLTHVNYAFALVNEQAEVYFRSPDSAASHLAALTALKKVNPRLKVLVSIGGWGADHFSDAALTADTRARFARTAVDLMRQHHLDGIDLDWEYPGHPGPGGLKFRAEDKQNFTLLLRACRTALDAASAADQRAAGDHYLLTIASSDGDYFDRTEMSSLHAELDWINVMTYDRTGEWSKTTGHHASLFASKDAPTAPSTDSAVQQHLGAGIPPAKIVVGAAFYGRGWTGVGQQAHGLLQPAEQPIDGNLSYARLAREFIGRDGYERHWDSDAQAAFLWNPTTGTFITYEDPAALRAKANYVKQHRLGGVMFWEQAHDPDGVLVEALHATLLAAAPSGAVAAP
ncbi:glycoside hydrolase family 18 protein [Opitutus terrae]|uniref:glycoside hydrolase family 18 protein n=1 Tax=Opitutus terrae TaxID=107709 RepID=UPI0002F7D891|nr:glycoside hydrolase family 18 protein [Opitutus terrae]